MKINPSNSTSTGKPEIRGSSSDLATLAFSLRPLGMRLREVGIVLMVCGVGGEIIAPVIATGGGGARGGSPERQHAGQDWLTALLHGSSLFRAHLKTAAGKWSSTEPTATEVMPGLWLVPMSINSRRRRSGFVVAVIATTSLLDSEQLVAMCQTAKTDLELTRRRLLQLPPAAPSEVGRLASLVRFAHEDHLRLTNDGQAIESVGKQLAESYEEMNLLYTIIQSMTVQQRPERFIAIACKELLATLPYAWIGTQFADDRNRLKSLAGRLIVAGEPGRPATELRDAARMVLPQAQPGASLVFDPTLNPKHAPLAALGKTVLVHPVSSNGEVVGLLIAGEKKGPDTAASSVDMKLLGATATHMAIFLENAALYDDLNAMFLGTLEALTASIDAKDRYTCGHSRRVASLTQQLAKAAGLDEYTVERMHIAGMVHDVGKIGVPEAVLLKPGKLTPEEFAWIRKHPEMGYRILKDIPQLSDILPGVLYHHERWDGKGYPEGLSGEGIPLVARMIALADSFDAMSSTRTYRSSLSRPQVLQEIIRCTGAQFDPKLAEVFVQLDFSEFDRMVLEHQQRERQQIQHEEAA